MAKSSEKPLISVIMSCFNEPRYQLEEAIESILNQTYKDLELIIILDDPENGELLKVLRSYEHRENRVRIHVQDKNEGLAAGRNKGIDMSRGEYVAMMDADDISLPSRLEKQLEWIESHDCDLVFSHMEYISDTGDTIGLFRPNLDRRTIFRDFLLKHIFAHPTVLVKKRVFSSEKYDESFYKGQDTDLWTRLLNNGFKFCMIPEVLFLCRLHREDVSYKTRIIRQRGYARYGVRYFLKHFHEMWLKPVFWLFGIKVAVYFLVLFSLPGVLLAILMRIKDSYR